MTTVTMVLDLAAATHAKAAALSRSHGWFARWHERQFARAIQAFIAGLEALPQQEAKRITGAECARIGELIDAVIEDVERFMARHGGAGLRRVERDRGLVRDIYELRRVFESLFRGVTADPHYSDMRWEMKVDPSRKP
jgi:hypothetical protein